MKQRRPGQALRKRYGGRPKTSEGMIMPELTGDESPLSRLRRDLVLLRRKPKTEEEK